MREDPDRARRDESLARRVDEQGVPAGVVEAGWQTEVTAPIADTAGDPGLPQAQNAGNITGTGQMLEIERRSHALGPLEKVYAFWMAGLTHVAPSNATTPITMPTIGA